MAFDILVLYSPKQMAVANWLGAQLQASGHRCGLVPQDFLPAPAQALDLVSGTGGARVLLLIPPNDERPSGGAARLGTMILPVRIEKMPRGNTALVFGHTCWIDAAGPDFAPHLDGLLGTIDRLLQGAPAASNPAREEIRSSPRPAARPAARTAPLPSPIFPPSADSPLKPLFQLASQPAPAPLVLGTPAAGGQ